MKEKRKTEKFLEDALASDTDNCIIWPYAKNICGYGKFRKGNLYNRSHHYICEQAHGEAPTPEHGASHSCGNRACVNPRHLSWKKNKILEFLEEALASVSDDCILWPYAKARGYGNFEKEDKCILAHRYICELAHGAAPTLKHEAAHACGNPACVNPQHLSWKSHKDNEADKILHGTLACGERHGRAKLTEAAVLEIRAEYANGNIMQKELADKWNVGQALISFIISRKNWKHI